ncbi:tyrosine--tRNA ligase [Candidatus Woesearchaeota archaeon]|nr:tyrosine--tRNA ligase [Candidatus Woesearchaeota archaeon]
MVRENGVSAVIGELSAIKGTDYVSLLADKFGPRFEEFVGDLQRQLAGALPQKVVQRTTARVLAGLETIVDDMIAHVGAIERGIAWVNSDFDLYVAYVRMKSNDVPESLRLNPSQHNVKLGMDPTNDSLHLGHLVPLRKLNDFARLGYNTVALLGTFTATIGDPSGRNEARPPLSEEEVMAYARRFEEQLRRILVDGMRIEYNHKWLTELTAADLIRIANGVNASTIDSRPDFLQRKRTGGRISFAEYIYPLLQAYDSVALRALFEIGGTDQKRNMLVGRDLQRYVGQEEQGCIAMPLLPSIDGVTKMSKTNPDTCIFLKDEPKDMYGKLMRIPDFLMPLYFELLTDRSINDIDAMKRALGEMGLIAQQGAKFARHFKIGDLTASRTELLNIIKEEERRYTGSVLIYTPARMRGIVEQLVTKLSEDGFFVRTVSALPEAQREFSSREYSVLIMDLSAKGNYDVLRTLRGMNKDIGVLGLRSENSRLTNGLQTRLMSDLNVSQVFPVLSEQMPDVIIRVIGSVYRNLPRGESRRKDVISDLQPLILRIEGALKRYVTQRDYSIRVSGGRFEILGNNEETQKAIDMLKGTEDMSEGYHPMMLKHDLAYRVVSQLHGEDATRAARQHFETQYQRRGLTEDLPIYQVPPSLVQEGGVNMLDLVRALREGVSNSQIRRWSDEGALRIRLPEGNDWKRVKYDHVIPVSDLERVAVKIGRGSYRLAYQPPQQ